MVDINQTTTVLLDGLRDRDNEQVWREFDQRYRPIILGFARRLGLRDADAADVAQETMTQFVKEYRAGKYDRTRGRLRSWLVGLTRTQVAMHHRRRGRNREVAGSADDLDVCDDHQLTRIWESQRQQVIMQQAMVRLRATTNLAEGTIRTFELFVVRQMPAAAVAEQLGIKPQDVYIAKGRVAQKLRDILTDLERAYQEVP